MESSNIEDIISFAAIDNLLAKGMILFIFYLIVINLIGLILMARDKQRAKKHQWRIKEKTFFLIALLFGSLGTWVGMYLFHHKTKHWYFVVGMPIIFIIQMFIIIRFYLL